jgi:hypothetical protein
LALNICELRASSKNEDGVFAERQRVPRFGLSEDGVEAALHPRRAGLMSGIENVLKLFICAPIEKRLNAIERKTLGLENSDGAELKKMAARIPTGGGKLGRIEKAAHAIKPGGADREQRVGLP